MFFPNSHLAEEAIFPYNLICMVQTELHNHIPLQEPKFYIPLESAGVYSLLTVTSSVIKNHRFVDGFVLLFYSTHKSQDGASRICLISKFFAVTKMEILKNTLIGGIESNIAGTKVLGVFS